MISFKKVLKKNYDDVLLVRIGLFITIMIAFTLAILIPSVIDLWYTIGSIFIPGLLFPVIGSYFEKWRLKEELTFIQVIAVTLTTFSIFLLKNFDLIRIDFEPMIAGILLGFVFQLSKNFVREGK